jgi:hypothetical protein
LGDRFRDLVARAPKAAAEYCVRWQAAFGEPADDVQIAECEAALSVTLSPSHRAFLNCYNGAHFAIDLFHKSGLAHEVRILSCAEMVAETTSERVFLNDFFAGIIDNPPLTSAIVVARYGHSGDICLGDPANTVDGEYVILDGFNEAPDAWRDSVIARTFGEWLERMLVAFVEEQSLLSYWIPAKIDELR